MASDSGKNVFIVGPGFIGWNVLDLLIEEGYSVTGYVRRREHAAGIEKSGAKAIFGDLNDTKHITEETTKHDIVFHTATADHKPSAEAICEGVLQRAQQGKSTIYIHTSGTSVLDDNSKGQYAGHTRYHDNAREEVDSLSETAPHRPIDLAILRYQEKIGDKAKIAIMIPPLIYGFNPKHERLTIQIPTMTQFALKHGYVGHVGKGLSVESHIHVMDLARGYVTLLHHMEKTGPREFLDNPYFFCENGNEKSWKEVATEIGKALYDAGKIKDATPREFPEDMYGELFGDDTAAVVGLNSISRAVRLRELGWEPKEKGVFDSFRDDELPHILKQHKGDFKGYGGAVAS